MKNMLLLLLISIFVLLSFSISNVSSIRTTPKTLSLSTIVTKRLVLSRTTRKRTRTRITKTARRRPLFTVNRSRSIKNKNAFIVPSLSCCTRYYCKKQQPQFQQQQQQLKLIRQLQLQLQLQQKDSDESYYNDNIENNSNTNNNESSTTTFTSTSTTITDTNNNNNNNDYKTMKVSEIRTVLKEMNINFADCFDKESLLQRLVEVKSTTYTNTNTKKTNVVNTGTVTGTETKTKTATTTANNKNVQQQKVQQQSSSVAKLDDNTINEIRLMTIRQLKEELSKRRIRWGTILDKEDLVRLVIQSKQKELVYSRTKKLIPGTVTDVTDTEFYIELVQSSSDTESDTNDTIDTLLLVDVYATWCGPCKIISEQLQLVANELYDTIRIIKIDSDKYSKVSSKYKIQGLPTLLLFSSGNSNSKGHENEVLSRIEGALSKQQIIDWIQQNS